MFGGRAPILITLYHGSQQVWLGLPFLWLFGTSVIGLRITHALFGLAVLAALFGLLLRSRLRPWQATVACAALAVDPTFTYAFRTQSYITLAPCAWLLLAFTLLLPSPPAGPSRRSWFWSGAFLGLAVVGYFIYAFFVPVLVALVAARFGAMTEAERFATKPLRSWIAGTAVGSSAYALGLFLAARESGGLAEFLSLLTEQQSTLGVFASNLSLWERVAYAWRMTAVGSVGNAWQHAMMFGDWTPVPWSSLKVGLLVAAPYATWIVAEYNQRAGLSLRALVASPIAFALTGLIFGGRLGGHHFVALLPIFYAALAVGVSRALPAKFSNAPARSVVTVAPLLVVALVNVTGQFAEAGVLAATRGNGLFSDAINRFADDLNRAARKPSVFTPDWGLALPIVFLTHGDVPVDSIEDFGKAKHALCSGRDVALALIEGDRAVGTRPRLESRRRRRLSSGPWRGGFRLSDFFGRYARAVLLGCGVARRMWPRLQRAGRQVSHPLCLTASARDTIQNEPAGQREKCQQHEARCENCGRQSRNEARRHEFQNHTGAKRDSDNAE